MSTPQNTPEMKRLFKATLPSLIYIFKNGKSAHFINGRYLTKIQSEIDELTAEIEAGHPQLKIDLEELEADVRLEDPIEALRAKIIKDYLAQQAEMAEGSTDYGKYTQGAVIPASSKDVAVAAVGGDGTAGLSALASRAAKLSVSGANQV